MSRKTPKRCACGLVRVTGVRCLHGAEPGRDCVSQRAADSKAKRKAHAARVESEKVHLSPEEQRKIGRALAKVDPLYGETHRRASRAAARSHRIGARR